MEINSGSISFFWISFNTAIVLIETLKFVPIIAITSGGMKGHGKICREIGINGYVTKPISQDDLEKAIESV